MSTVGPSTARWTGLVGWLGVLRSSDIARTSAANAIANGVDYLAQPLLMVAAAPILVARLGLEQYGVWMLVMALAGSLSIFGFGFGDATIRYVSKYRGAGDICRVEQVAGTSLFVTVFLSAAPAALVVLAAPFLAGQISNLSPSLLEPAAQAFRLGGLLLLLRSVDFIFISVLRAHEKYVVSVRISTLTKLGTVVAAIACAVLGYGVREILASCVFVAFFGAAFQAAAVASHVSWMAIVPRFHRAAWQEMAGFGFFTWLQGMSAMVIGYADRLLIGVMLGATPVAYYTICVQVTQPIHGLVAAAYNFLFPHISSRRHASATWDPRNLYRKAARSNVLTVALAMLPLLFFGRPLLTLWLGAEFAAHSYPILFVLTLAYGGLALNVVPHFTLLALGHARFVSLLNVIGGCLTLAAAATLIPVAGVLGAAVGRALYGPITWLAYGKVARELEA